MDGLMSFTVMERIVFFLSEECRVVLDRLRVIYSWMVLYSIEDFIDGELQRSEVLFYLKCL